jgi:hypothetical protein
VRERRGADEQLRALERKRATGLEPATFSLEG